MHDVASCIDGDRAGHAACENCLFAFKGFGPRPFESDPKSPNIILVTLDTTRADRMGFLGSQRGLTPNLDALAKQSVVFTHAYSQVPLTTASHATILTGTYPQFHLVNNLHEPLPADLPDTPEILRDPDITLPPSSVPLS